MNENQPKKPRCVIEIVGVCGSGKSTLTRAVTDQDPEIELEEFLQFKKLDHVRSAVRSVPGVARILSRAVRAGRLPDVTELKLVMYLMVWHRRLDLRPGDANRIVVIDQGPVYALATLRRTNPGLPGTEPDGCWWRSVLAKWADTLDVIVWLDAPDDVLLERVQNRSDQHEIKGEPPDQGLAYIRAYRAAFDATLSEFDQHGGPAVLRYDTSHWTSERLIPEVLERVAGFARHPA